MAISLFHNRQSKFQSKALSFPSPLSSILCASIFLGLLYLFLTLPPTVLRPFHSKGEPREALVAQSMLTSNNWILPKRYQDAIATKPPMTHWMMATLGSLSGQIDEFSARAPSLIISLVTILGLFLFLNKWTTREHGFLCALMLMTSSLWFRSSITCRVDMPLAGFLTGALLLLFIWNENEFKDKRVYYGIVACLVAGTLTKGPVALVLPALIWTVYLLLRNRTIEIIWKSGLSIFLPALLLSSLWYLLAYYRGGAEFLQVVLSENVSRMTGEIDTGRDPHQHSILFLIGTLLLGMIPWSLLLFLIPWSRVISFKNISLLESPRSFLQELPRVQQYSVVACLSIFGFYCIPASKKAEYLLPLYPFLCILVVSVVMQARSISKRFLERFSVLLLSLVMAVSMLILGTLLTPDALYFALPLQENIFLQESLPKILSGLRWLIPLLSAWVLFLGIHIYAIYYSGKSSSLRFALICYLGTIGFTGALIVPAVSSELSAKHFAREVTETLPPETKIYAQELFYGMDFYLGGRILTFNTDDETSLPAYVLVSKKRYSEFKEELSASRHTEIALTSSHDIRKPGGTVLLVKVY